MWNCELQVRESSLFTDPTDPAPPSLVFYFVMVFRAGAPDSRPVFLLLEEMHHHLSDTKGPTGPSWFTLQKVWICFRQLQLYHVILRMIFFYLLLVLNFVLILIRINFYNWFIGSCVSENTGYSFNTYLGVLSTAIIWERVWSADCVS